MTITLASNNNHKISEINSILSDIQDISVISMAETGFTGEIIEDGDSFTANALIKARTLYSFTSRPVISDDSGLCVDYLNGEPGIYSARYKGLSTDEDRYMYILNSLDGIAYNQRSARFVCVIAFIDSEGAEFLFEGTCNGHIAESPSGDNGFGYDPVFVPEGYTASMAELSSEEKNSISHRGLALRKFRSFMTESYTSVE